MTLILNFYFVLQSHKSYLWEIHHRIQFDFGKRKFAYLRYKNYVGNQENLVIYSMVQLKSYSIRCEASIIHIFYLSSNNHYPEIWMSLYY